MEMKVFIMSGPFLHVLINSIVKWKFTITINSKTLNLTEQRTSLSRIKVRMHELGLCIRPTTYWHFAHVDFETQKKPQDN
jgi:hypothetical protein